MDKINERLTKEVRKFNENSTNNLAWSMKSRRDYEKLYQQIIDQYPYFHFKVLPIQIVMRKAARLYNFINITNGKR